MIRSDALFVSKMLEYIFSELRTCNLKVFEKVYQ
jgi:hypothetical protein